MKLKGKGINLQALVECGSYLSFSILLFRLTSSGRYLNFVTPRMKPYLYGLSFLMFLWAVVEGRHLLTPRYKVKLSRTFVLIFPILLLLGPPPQPEGSSMVRSFDDVGLSASAGTGSSLNGNTPSDRNGSSGTSGTGSYGAAGTDGASDSNGASDSYGSSDASDSYGSSDTSDSQDSGAAQSNLQEFNPTDLKGLDEKTKTITIADQDYYGWLVELGTHPEKYKDYTVVAKGFIYRDPEIEKKCNFALVRLSMWCCAADLAPIGFLVDYNGKLEFNKNEWVVVTGTFGVGADGSIHLKAKSIKAGQKPKEEYVYPF